MSSSVFDWDSDSDSLGTEGEKLNPEHPSIRRNKGDVADEPCAKKAKVVSDEVMPVQSLELKGFDGKDGQTVRTFDIDRLPFEMKVQVVGKMSIDTLCEFRRTSKENEQFVRENRCRFRPEINRGRLFIEIRQNATDSVVIKRSRFPFLSREIELTWEERWELLGITNIFGLTLAGISGEKWHSEVLLFLKKLLPTNHCIEQLSFFEINIEDMHEIANFVIAESVSFMIDGCTFVGSHLPFLQQWQTDKFCRLEQLFFYRIFRSNQFLPINEFVSLLENDDRLEKVWDVEMHERSILRNYNLNKMLAHSIYTIARNFEVDVEHGSKLGRNGILFVLDREVRFLTCRAGATVEESLKSGDMLYTWTRI